jgi:hypothetical protein
MAPSALSARQSHVAGGNDGVYAAAAAVFGALDLLDEFALAEPADAGAREAREGAEAALQELGLDEDDLRHAWNGAPGERRSRRGAPTRREGATNEPDGGNETEGQLLAFSRPTEQTHAAGYGPMRPECTPTPATTTSTRHDQDSP